MSVKEHTDMLQYEQEIVYHLNEIKYWTESAENAAEEFRLAISRKKYHEDELSNLQEPPCALA